MIWAGIENVGEIGGVKYWRIVCDEVIYFNVVVWYPFTQQLECMQFCLLAADVFEKWTSDVLGCYG